MSNFYSNISKLYTEGYLSEEQLVNAIIKNFITTDEYVKIKGSEEDALNGVKAACIAKTKTDLETYLATHPYTTDDGKQYSVTTEKQNLLSNEIASYQLATAAKQPYQIKWNTTGSECENFTIEQITALALAINAYVKPMVSYQQAQEVAIRNASTIQDVLGVQVDYATLSA